MTDDNLEKAVDAVFEHIRDVTYYTSVTAKEIILQANKLKMTSEAYLMIVSSYIKDFEKSKEGITNESIGRN